MRPVKPAGKRETLLAFLERGIAMLHIDTRRDGVEVPSQHAGDPHLRLNLSYRYGIPDLIIDETHVQATLSFGGRPFRCELPWTAVFGITSQVSGDGQVWPEDLPPEVMSSLASEQRRAEKPAPAKKSSRPTLVAVAGDRDEKHAAKSPAVAPAVSIEEKAAAKDDGKPDEPPPDGSSPPRKGHLRLIR